MGTVRIPNYDVMRLFINTGIHGVVWPKQTLCAFRLPETGLIVRTNTLTFHAEDFVLQILHTRILNGYRPIDVVIYSNMSPCRRCCSRIKQFLDTFPGYTLTIVFASLYNIDRPSCEMRDPPCTVQHKTTDGHQHNLDAMKTLLTKTNLRPFQRHDWKVLSLMLGLGFAMDPALEEARQVEDDFVQLDWMELVMKPLYLHPFEQGQH